MKKFHDVDSPRRSLEVCPGRHFDPNVPGHDPHDRDYGARLVHVHNDLGPYSASGGSNGSGMASIHLSAVDARALGTALIEFADQYESSS